MARNPRDHDKRLGVRVLRPRRTRRYESTPGTAARARTLSRASLPPLTSSLDRSAEPSSPCGPVAVSTGYADESHCEANAQFAGTAAAWANAVDSDAGYCSWLWRRFPFTFFDASRWVFMQDVQAMDHFES